MLKVLPLQQWYSLSDMEAEKQIADRISFMKFLSFPDSIPDSKTIWLFRERLKETGKDKAIWEELQRQLDAKGLTIKRGSIQDATFIEADPGKSKGLRGEILLTDVSRSLDGVETFLRLDVVEMAPGLRRAMNFILAISFILRSISDYHATTQ